MGRDMNERAPRTVAGGGKAAVATGGVGIGAVGGYMLDPAKGLEFLKWLSAAVQPQALIAIVTLGAGCAVAVATNWFFWKRLKEKDRECRDELKTQREGFEAEMARQREAWERVVNKKETQIDVIAKTLEGFLAQVTLLAERARVSSAQTRSN